MACWGFKDLNRRTAADKVLHHNVFDVAENPKHDRYQCGLVSMIYKFFDKKASRETATNEIYLIKN